MTRLRLISNAGPAATGPAAPRLRGHLQLVANTGSSYRQEPVRRPGARAGEWLSISVAVAAMAASTLVATSGYQQVEALIGAAPAASAASSLPWAKPQPFAEDAGLDA